MVLTAPSKFDTAAHLVKVKERLLSFGRQLDRMEFEFEVDHSFHGGTWLKLSAYDRSVHVSKHANRVQRDLQQIAYSGPVIQLDNYPSDHTLGICPECSIRWNGEQA